MPSWPRQWALVVLALILCLEPTDLQFQIQILEFLPVSPKWSSPGRVLKLGAVTRLTWSFWECVQGWRGCDRRTIATLLVLWQNTWQKRFNRGELNLELRFEGAVVYHSGKGKVYGEFAVHFAASQWTREQREQGQNWLGCTPQGSPL